MLSLHQIWQSYLSDWRHLWVVEYAWLPLGLVMVLAAGIGRRMAPAVGLAFFWFGFCALRGFANVRCPFPGWNEEMALIYQSSAAAALAFLFLYLLMPIAMGLETWALVFKAIAVVNAWWIIVGAFFHCPWGVLLNASMSGCLSAVLLPLFFPVRSKAGFFFLFTVLASIFFAQQSLPLATLATILGVYLLRNGQWKRLGMAGVGCLLVGTAISRHEDGSLFNTHGRWLTWSDSLDWFWHHNNVWIGTGTGSYLVAGPILTAKTGNIWLWAHSDYVQVLIEQGVIGLMLLLGLYFAALSRAWDRPKLFYSLIGYGAFAGANMPIRYPIAAMFGAFLIHWAFQNARNPKETLLC